MAARTVALNATKGGIDRQRIIGSPSPDTLYDLVNGYRDAANVMLSRPGTRAQHDLSAGATKGMVAYQGGFVVFSNQPVGTPDGVTCEVLVHPVDPSLQISRIRYANPFLRHLFVVAEFTDGSIYYYWLQNASTWAADSIYTLGALVQPTVPNGFVYRALRLGDPNPLWAPNVNRTIGERVEPTVADGYFYEVVATAGATPRSGATEPEWNDEDGALTYENVDVVPPAPPVTGPTDPGIRLPPIDEDRYGGGFISLP